jgi:hypothetical protein
VPEHCTCGALPPDDARFCHKCGRPLRDEPVALPEEPEEPEEIPPTLSPRAESQRSKLSPQEPPSIGFHNPVAVRVGLFGAAMASLLNIMPVIGLGCPLWLLAAGFFSAYLYSRRTQSILNVREGARVGWITGVFSFAIYVVIFTIGFISMTRRGGLAALDREQLAQIPWLTGDIEETLRLMQDPSFQVIGLILSLLFLFVLFAMVPLLGGALAARIMQKD